MTSFDLNELIQLAQNDPETFEQRRLELIDHFINSHPAGERQEHLLKAQQTINKRFTANKRQPTMHILAFNYFDH